MGCGKDIFLEKGLVSSDVRRFLLAARVLLENLGQRWWSVADDVEQDEQAIEASHHRRIACSASSRLARKSAGIAAGFFL